MPTASHPDDLLLLDAKVADQLYMYSQNLPMRALPPAEIDFPEGGEAAVVVKRQLRIKTLNSRHHESGKDCV